METGSSFTGTDQKNYGRATKTDRLRCPRDGSSSAICSENCSCRYLSGKAIALLRAAPAAATSLDAVDFDQTDAGGIIFAARNRCPVPLNKCGQNGWLPVVTGGEAGCLNRRLLRIFPIIVRTNQVSVAIKQIQRWVEQSISNPKAS